MGPYCRFCERRCFIPIPANAPAAALTAYGSSTIVATCPEGKRFEREQVGWDIDAIRAAMGDRPDLDDDGDALAIERRAPAHDSDFGV
jgi:hypothetical protein